MSKSLKVLAFVFADKIEITYIYTYINIYCEDIRDCHQWIFWIDRYAII